LLSKKQPAIWYFSSTGKLVFFEVTALKIPSSLSGNLYDELLFYKQRIPLSSLRDEKTLPVKLLEKDISLPAT